MGADMIATEERKTIRLGPCVVYVCRKCGLAKCYGERVLLQTIFSDPQGALPFNTEYDVCSNCRTAIQGLNK